MNRTIEQHLDRPLKLNARDRAMLSGILIFGVFVVCQTKTDTLSRVSFFFTFSYKKDGIKTFIRIYDNDLHSKCGTNSRPPLFAV